MSETGSYSPVDCRTGASWCSVCPAPPTTGCRPKGCSASPSICSDISLADGHVDRFAGRAPPCANERSPVARLPSEGGVRGKRGGKITPFHGGSKYHLCSDGILSVAVCTLPNPAVTQRVISCRARFLYRLEASWRDVPGGYRPRNVDRRLFTFFPLPTTPSDDSGTRSAAQRARVRAREAVPRWSVRLRCG